MTGGWKWNDMTGLGEMRCIWASKQRTPKFYSIRRLTGVSIQQQGFQSPSDIRKCIDELPKKQMPAPSPNTIGINE